MFTVCSVCVYHLFMFIGYVYVQFQFTFYSWFMFTVYTLQFMFTFYVCNLFTVSVYSTFAVCVYSLFTVNAYVYCFCLVYVYSLCLCLFQISCVSLSWTARPLSLTCMGRWIGRTAWEPSLAASSRSVRRTHDALLLLLVNVSKLLGRILWQDLWS